MKARFIAIVILLCLVGLPIFGYWYFYRSNIASVEVVLGVGMSADIRLKWTFSQSWLPLADRAVDYRAKCEEKCVFSPVLPADYTLSVISDDFSEFSENFSVKSGQYITRQISLTKKAEFMEVSVPQPLTADEKILRNDDIREVLGQDFSLINKSISGDFWIVKNTDSGVSVGIFQWNNFLEKISFPSHFSSISLDFYGNILIFSHSENEKTFFHIPSETILNVKIPENFSKIRFENGEWQIKTTDKIFSYKNEIWRENPRFSDFADMDNFRAGYISKTHENLLSLSNYSLSDGGVFLLMNRQNGDIFEIAKNIEIWEIFSYNEKIIFENSWKFYSVNLPK